jgi:hypothetical protein
MLTLLIFTYLLIRAEIPRYIWFHGVNIPVNAVGSELGSTRVYFELLHRMLPIYSSWPKHLWPSARSRVSTDTPLVWREVEDRVAILWNLFCAVYKMSLKLIWLWIRDTIWTRNGRDRRWKPISAGKLLLPITQPEVARYVRKTDRRLNNTHTISRVSPQNSFR